MTKRVRDHNITMDSLIDEFKALEEQVVKINKKLNDAVYFRDMREAALSLAPETMKVFVKLLDGSTHVAEVPRYVEVEYLKCQLGDLTSIPIDQQRLLFTGKNMQDDHKLKDYGVKDKSTIHMAMRLRGC